MPASKAVFRFENAVPTVTEIIARFKEHTGLDLEIDLEDPPQIIISHPTFGHEICFWVESNTIHHEFIFGPYDYQDYVFWSILRDLGARSVYGEISIPKWTQKQWKDVKWWERSFLLRNPGYMLFGLLITMILLVLDIPVRILIFLDRLKKQR